MTIYPLQASFIRGELSPKLHGRVDIEQYGQSLKDATNWMVMRQGGVTRRPGTIFIGALRDETEKGRVVEFEFNDEQAYAIVFNDTAIRFATLGAQVVQTAQNITGITKANPGVVTYSGSDTYTNGDRVLITGVVGMTEVNNREFEVANVNTSGAGGTFELSGVNTSGFTTYSSGGTVAEIYELANEGISEANIFGLQFAQAGDSLYYGSSAVYGRKLVRSAETSWTENYFFPEDGPWMEEDTGGATMLPASTGSVVDVDMTSNSTSSYTAADDDTSVNAFKVFDRDLSTTLDLPGVSGWVSIDFPSTTEKIADAYWIAASSVNPECTPTHWTFEGQNSGGSWIVIDTVADETAWAPGERRYFEIPNATAFRGYRLQWYAVDGGTSTKIKELVIHESGASQTAFDLTASAITNINAGVGFHNNDATLQRMVRLLGSDGVWRYAKIITRTSSTVVTVRLYGHALFDTSPITRWQMSLFADVTSGPLEDARGLGFYNDRLAWGGTEAQPYTVSLSRSSSYDDYGVSDPPQDSDGINTTITGGTLSRVNWLEEIGDDLAIGTGGGIRVMGPTSAAEAFSSFNIQQKKRTSVGAATIQPLPVDDKLIFVDRYRKRIFEFGQNEYGKYAATELSVLSDHLFAPNVVECAFQEDRDNLAWFVMEDGSVAVVSYEASQGVSGFTPVVLGGVYSTGNPVVESVAAIPSAGGAAVYFIVKRTINGATRRYLEYMAPKYDSAAGDNLDDAVYLDCSVTETVSGATTVTGLTWLIGETVGLFINGVDEGDVVVSSGGTVTLPATTTGTVTVGLRYTSRGETLRAPTSGNRDGSAMGRQMVLHSVAVDMLDTAGLEVGSLTDTTPIPAGEFAPDDGELSTGVFDVIVDDSHANNGVVVFSTDRAYPATIRALILGLEGAP